MILLTSCKTVKIPKTSLSQYYGKVKWDYRFVGNELELKLKNDLYCPVRIWVQPRDSQLLKYFDLMNPIVLKPLEKKVVQAEANGVKAVEIDFASRLGDTSQIITAKKVELPFLNGKKYKFIQGYNSNPTHNTDWSRYALDFGLPIGDTICSATQGYVVGVVEGYKYGGIGKEWKNYGNFITIYDPQTGLYTQYAHLKYNGSYVEVGDKVKAGQIIGIAGMTGQTNIEHLHFNCLKPAHSEAGLISIPIDSIGNYKVSEIVRNDFVKKRK